MTFKNPMTRTMVEVAAFTLGLQARSDRSLEPWSNSLLRLQDGDVEAASEIAAKAFNNGASLEDRKHVINLISLVAIENNNRGHWYETLLLQAAEGGLSHCAYNVGNLIAERATSPADHALAHRYFTQAAQNATDPATKASALVNFCAPIRDGLITGTPDWKRAIEIYEEAAALNLAVGMFNAANVACWLKDKGEFAYAARAVKWLNTLITRVDAGETFVDIGGDAEVQEVYWRAKSRLAELHALSQVEAVDVDLIFEMAAAEPDADRAAWFRGWGYEHRLQKTAVMAKPAAWANWLSVLTILGWELDCEPTDLNLGPNTGDSRLLKFKREKGSPLALAVVDLVEVESNDGVYRLRDLVNAIQDEHDGPCLAIGSKGLFIGPATFADDRSYTVCVSCSNGINIAPIPIWPGATVDDVAAQMDHTGSIFTEHNTDNGNTIAIMVNALGTGRNLDGVNFPRAIYVNVGSVFYSPIFTVEQAIELGSKIPPTELAKSLKGVKEHFEAQAQRQREYCGTL
jgi:TPR repeat protein